MSELKLINIDNGISYITPSESPLSSNVAIIECEDSIWLYDVGNHSKVVEYIEELNHNCRRINVVLSHFHPDHIGNLELLQNMNEVNIYQGKYTYRHTNTGNVVSDDMYIESDNHTIHIFPIPSCHAKGCLALEVDEQYCFLGDALYPATKGATGEYNKSLLKEEINVLKDIKAPYFMLSHKEPYARPKNVVMAWIEKIYKGL